MEKEAEYEIDISQLAQYLRKKAAVMIVTSLVFMVLGWLVGTFLVTPEYTASTRVYVLNRTNQNGIVFADIQISTYLSQDFEVLITGPNVTQVVRSRLNLEMTDRELASMIEVTPMEDTRVLCISVTHTDPQLAADIANCVREISAEQIRDFVDSEAVKTVYEADLPTHPSSRSASQIAMTAAIAGFLLCTCICSVTYILDDTIRTEADVEHYLGMSVLGIIPEADDLVCNIATAPSAKQKRRKNGKHPC